jgi:hypothetical protein
VIEVNLDIGQPLGSLHQDSVEPGTRDGVDHLIGLGAVGLKAQLARDVVHHPALHRHRRLEHFVRRTDLAQGVNTPD